MNSEDMPPQHPALPQRVVAELQTNALRIKAAVCALRLWEWVLTEDDRKRLGGELEDVWRRYGTAGIWMKLRGVSRERAVVDVAYALNLIDPSAWFKSGPFWVTVGALYGPSAPRRCRGTTFRTGDQWQRKRR